MRKLIVVRPLPPDACAQLSRGFEAHGISLTEGQLLQFAAEGRTGRRITLIAEIQSHLMTLAGLVSARFAAGVDQSAPDGGVAELTDLIVLPHCRRNGVAARMLDSIEKAAGRKAVWLVVAVERLPHQQAGRALFAGRGYAPAAWGGTAVDLAAIGQTAPFMAVHLAKPVKPQD